MRAQIDKNTTSIQGLNREVSLRAGEASMGSCLERLAASISNEVGEPKHQFKLNDEGFMQEEFKTPDGAKLKAGVEQLIGKLEILSRSAVT